MNRYGKNCCPRCRSNEILTIVYGTPTPETLEKAKAQKVVLGGTCFATHSPKWHCQTCQYEFGRFFEKPASSETTPSFLPMNNRSYQIRIMSRDEIEIAINWAAIEGWNPGIYDWHSFYAADPDGFLIGLLDDEPIACISAVKYGETLGFIGFYIVKPEYRGQGYGLQIWQAAIQSLQGRTIGLDGVVSQQGNYQKFGFKLAYQNIRYQGLSKSKVTQGSSEGSFQGSPKIVDLMSCHWQSIIGFDQAIFSVDRTDFLFSWLNQPDSHAFAYLDNEQVVGYGMVRACREGFKIGPLFAETEAQAEALLQALLAKLPEGSVFFLDIPATNAGAVNLVHRYDMQPVFETARMYIGGEPDVPVHKVYGVTSFELG